jgi:hypothetical protein
MICAEDPIAALAQTDTAPALLMLEIISFQCGLSMRVQYEMSINNFYNNSNTILITAQILDMEQVFIAGQSSWMWKRSYICAKLTVTNGRISCANYTIQFCALLPHPLAPSLKMRDTHMGAKATWSCEDHQLQAALDKAWQDLQPDGPEILANLLALPCVNQTEMLPYCGINGKHFEVDFPIKMLRLI